MTNQDLKDKLNVLQGQYASSEITVEKIKHLLDLVDRIPDCVSEVIRSIKYFYSTLDNPSRTDADLNDMLDTMIDEARNFINQKQERIKETAVAEMRKSRKGPVIAAIVVLSILAGVAVVLGILGAFNVMPEVCCDIVGVADCMFGIVFFVYELYSDRLAVSEINSGDKETIKKYTKQIPIRIGQQVNINSQVINAPVYGNVIMNTISKPKEISEAISKLFSDL